MLFLFAISCLAAATVGSVVLYQRGISARLAEGRLAAALPAVAADWRAARPDATLETLQLGDVVLDGTDDWIVTGTASYREEQDTWALHRLDAGPRVCFLEVRPRTGPLAVTFLEPVDDAPLFGTLGSGLTYRDRSLLLEQRGDARTTVRGDVGGRTAAILKYARYEGAGGAVLLLEEEHGSKRAYFGHRVPPSSLTIYGA